MFAVVPAGVPAFTQIKLQFTTNRGASAVCVGALKLFNQGKPVAFPADTKSKHEGIWSDGYHSDNLVTGKGYYCSKHDSFKAGKGSEEVLVTMPKPLSFDSFSLSSVPWIEYSPKGFVVSGLRPDGEWVELRRETDFKFAKAVVVTTFKTSGTPVENMDTPES